MAIRILSESKSNDYPVEPKTVIETLEKNRDRVRLLVTMMISTTSILFSANLAVLAFLKDKLDTLSVIQRLFFLISPLILLMTIFTGIVAVFLRQDFSVGSSVKFIDNLLTLYHAELRNVRIGFTLLLLGAICLFLSIIMILFS